MGTVVYYFADTTYMADMALVMAGLALVLACTALIDRFYALMAEDAESEDTD